MTSVFHFDVDHHMLEGAQIAFIALRIHLDLSIDYKKGWLYLMELDIGKIVSQRLNNLKHIAPLLECCYYPLQMRHSFLHI